MSESPSPSSQPDPTSTEEMLSSLDQATKTIPKMLENLSAALAVLEREPSTDAEKAKWERDLRGFSGQYYGRLDQIQSHLRNTLHTLCRPPSPTPSTLTPLLSPFALRPPPFSLRPTFSTSLPAAFVPPTTSEEDDLFLDLEDDEVQQEKEKEEKEQVRRERELGLYALRLEKRGLEGLVESLRGMREGAEGDGGGGGGEGETGGGGGGKLLAEGGGSSDEMDES